MRDGFKRYDAETALQADGSDIMSRGVRTPKTQTKGMTYTRLLTGMDASAETVLDALAQIIVPVDSFIIGIQGVAGTFGTADDNEATFEVSLSGNYAADTNDNADTLMVLRSTLDFLTSGKTQMNLACSTPAGMKVPVSSGERIYLNLTKITSLTAKAQFVIHLQRR